MTPPTKIITCTPVLVLGLVCLLTGCAFQSYNPKPLEAAKTAGRLKARDPASAEFQQYLAMQGYSASPQQWGLEELTFSAFYFHPQLEVARAQWKAAQAAEITVGKRPNPGISGLIERHSEDDGVSPWLFGISIDIRIETANKRQARIDQAAHLSEAARIEIGQMAWTIKRRLAESWISYNESLHQVKILEDELALRQEILDILKARLDAGMVSSIELGNASLLLQKTQQTLLAERGRIPELRTILAANAGLPSQALNQLSLKSPVTQATGNPETPDLPSLQDAALLNRLDIRAALSRYAAAEARLRLEIARQYPDVVLSPGYSYDQGDRIWSLGFSTLLALLDKNEGLIAEATSLREVEGAQFLALQANVIAELEQAHARYTAAIDEQEKARGFLVSQQEQETQIARQFDNGYADRLEFTTARLTTILAQQALLAADYKVERATEMLEDAIQRPLEQDFTQGYFATPADPTQQEQVNEP
jgi:cobalt-zinc-cadmium efflux system outer membrane protein